MCYVFLKIYYICKTMHRHYSASEIMPLNRWFNADILRKEIVNIASGILSNRLIARVINLPTEEAAIKVSIGITVCRILLLVFKIDRVFKLHEQENNRTFIKIYPQPIYHNALTLLKAAPILLTSTQVSKGLIFGALVASFLAWNILEVVLDRSSEYIFKRYHLSQEVDLNNSLIYTKL
ncbi:MAG: hypothetical protein Tsb0021_12160 [Chlamydiales bacterium]